MIGPRQDVRRTSRALSVLMHPVPVLLAAAGVYGVQLLISLPTILRAVGNNSDAVAPMLLTEEGVTHDYHGQYLQLWFDQLTAHLPAHRFLWSVVVPATTLLALVLVAWTAYRVWGGAPALMFAVVAAAVSPLLIFNMLAQGWHTDSVVAAAATSAWLVWIWSPRSGSQRLRVLYGSVVAVLLGLALVSDYLTLLIAWVPLALLTVAAWFGRYGDRQARTWAAAVTVLSGLGALVIGSALKLFSGSAGFHAIEFAGYDQLIDNARLVAHLFLGMVHGTFLGRPVSAEPLISIAAAAVLVSLLGWAMRRVRDVTATLRSDASEVLVGFWALSLAATVLGFGLSTLGDGLQSARYFLAAWWAVAILAAYAQNTVRRAGWRASTAVAAAAAFVIILNGAGLVQARNLAVGYESTGPTVGVGDIQMLVTTLQQHGLTRGYAGYWQADSVTWASHGTVLSRPVLEGKWCNSHDKGAVCRDLSFSDSSWYSPQPGPSFLVVHAGPADEWVPDAPSPSLGVPLYSYIVSGFVVYVYPDDISNRFIAS